MMTVQTTNPLEAFQWTPQPEAERFVGALIDQFLSLCPTAAHLADRMKSEAGTRFLDWIDSIWLPDTAEYEAFLNENGFAHSCVDGPEDRLRVFIHPGGIFPTVALARGASNFTVQLKVEAVVDFAAANPKPFRNHYIRISGSPLSTYRRLVVSGPGDRAALVAAERHGFRGFIERPEPNERKFLALRHSEEFRLRRRDFTSDWDGRDADEHGFALATSLIDSAILDLGINLACDLFFAAERHYWQRRNRAAQIQKARQDRLGLGWANHDHHTYRSSRRHFARLISVFEKLGFHCRERFYAGKQAGWGAQVLEQPNAGIVIFADVDLSPDELLIDFAHEPLPQRDALGTVGLWCALHGESFLQAGMHHLECQFDFDALRDQLGSAGVGMMKPFTDFPYLRQAFTEGERWPVEPERIDRLLRDGRITQEQAGKFRAEGAIGSHLENLERNQGFKGFNQTGVSEIIAATDPRKHLGGMKRET